MGLISDINRFTIRRILLLLVFLHRENILHLGVCDIYHLRYYRNCCFNDVQFDNIEYFAKTKQNAYINISLRGD